MEQHEDRGIRDGEFLPMPERFEGRLVTGPESGGWQSWEFDFAGNSKRTGRVLTTTITVGDVGDAQALISAGNKALRLLDNPRFLGWRKIVRRTDWPSGRGKNGKEGAE